MVGTRESVINTCVITTSRKKRIINIHREQDIGNNMRNKCDNFPCGMSSKERTSEASSTQKGELTSSISTLPLNLDCIC